MKTKATGLSLQSSSGHDKTLNVCLRMPIAMMKVREESIMVVKMTIDDS